MQIDGVTLAHHSLPHIQKGIDAAHRFGGSELAAAKTIPPLLWRQWKDGDIRAMRRERRQAVGVVIGWLFHNTEVKSRGFATVQTSLDWVAKQSGLCRRRVARVMRDLIRAGALITIRRPIEWKGGKPKARAAVRKWSMGFLEFCRVRRSWRKAAKQQDEYFNEELARRSMAAAAATSANAKAVYVAAAKMLARPPPAAAAR